MALGLSEEHRHLAETIRSWAQRNCPPEAVRAAADGQDSGSAKYLESFGPSLAEQGVLGLHLPEEDGGQGFGLPELAVALEELGRALVPGAALPTVLASAVLTAAGITGKLVVGLADGSKGGAVGLADGLTGQRRGRRRADHRGRRRPRCSAPAWPTWSSCRCRPATARSGPRSTRAPWRSPRWTVSTSPARWPGCARPGVTVPADRLLSGLDRTAVTSLAAILFGAEASGMADWAVQTAAEYAKLRQQFGRPIGQFQAVKHRCAWMLTSAELAAAAVWDAARTEPDTPLARPAAGAPASWPPSGSASSRRAWPGYWPSMPRSPARHECIQVLGGIGYTWDHPAHLYYRRAMSLRALLGPSARGAERVAELARSGVRRPMQVELPGGDGPLRERLRGELAEIAALTGAERARALADGGWVIPHLPRPWGRGADAPRAGGHRPGNARGPGAGPSPHDRRLGRARADPVRDAGPAGQVPAAHAAGRDHLVPAVQRAGGRVGPGRPDHHARCAPTAAGG